MAKKEFLGFREADALPPDIGHVIGLHLTKLHRILAHKREAWPRPSAWCLGMAIDAVPRVGVLAHAVIVAGREFGIQPAVATGASVMTEHRSNFREQFD